MTSCDELIRTTNGSVGEIPTIELKKKDVWFIIKPLWYETIKISVELSKWWLLIHGWWNH